MDDFNYYNDIFDIEMERDELTTRHRYRERLDPFTAFTDDEFRNRYRFQKETVAALVDLVREELVSSGSRRGLPLTAEQQVLMFLRFMATGCFQREIGDFHGLSQSAVSNLIHRVAEKIAGRRASFIQFPRPANAFAVHDGFYNIAPFPGVIGLIDCTHVPISNPGGDYGELFRNRKGWFSLNVQVVCNDKMEITNVVARWPGSTHDARIFNCSNMCQHLERTSDLGHLLGDQGYPCLTTLLTPLSNPATLQERRYNKAHRSVRNRIECLFGIWKRRFPALSKGLRFKPEKCAVIVVAASVLHNLAITRNEQDFEEEDPEDLQDDSNCASAEAHTDTRGTAKRAHLIANSF